MPNAGPQGPYRKSLAVKHSDGEPLTRVDIQYDLLYYLFSDSQAVFTDPFPTISGAPAGTKVTFRDLYVNALAHSTKCSKVTKDKLLDTPDFGVEFSKISLLSNVGRINTTMAFFPEMRTALRTYHPVPSLQKTDGNLQDAPRIKNILKSSFTPSERENPPITPADLLARSRSGEVPPTSIVNMMFVFAGHAAVISQTHFGSQTSHDFLDFFCPVNISSESRARAILWLCYHYLEAPSPNPFNDDYSRSHPGKIPELVMLSEEEFLLENVDPPEEKEWGEKMSSQRKIFMANKDKEVEAAGDNKDSNGPREKPVKGRGRGSKAKATAAGRRNAGAKQKGKISSPAVNELTIIENDLSPGVSGHRRFATSSPFRHSPAPSSLHIAPLSTTPPPGQARSRTEYDYDLPSVQRTRARVRNSVDPYPRRSLSPLYATLHSTDGEPVRTRQRKTREKRSGPTTFPYLRELPSAPGYDAATLQSRQSADATCAEPDTSTRREGLEQAFHVVMSTDPLQDSEEEEEADENTRSDLLLRLQIINRLRGKEPTPELEHVPMDPVPFTFSRAR